MAIKLGDAELILTGDNSKLKKTMRASEGVVRGSASKMSKTLASIGKAGVVAFAGLAVGATAAVVSSVKAFGEMEKGIAEVLTLVAKSPAEAKKMEKAFSDTARTIAVDYGQKLPAVIQGMYDAISAGVPQESVGTFLADAAKLAVAGASDISTSVDLLTSVQNAYGIAVTDTADTSDKLFATVKAGKTTIDELASAIGRVAPIAAATGVSLEELLAFTATLTKTGLSTAESMTALKAVITGIQKPTTEAEEAAKKLGISFDADTLASVGLAGMIEIMAQAFDKDSNAASDLFGSVEALGGVLAAVKSEGREFIGILDGIKDSSGETAIGFETMASTQSFAIEQMKARFTDLKVSIGEVFADPAVEAISKVSSALSNNSDQWAALAAKVLEATSEIAVGIAEIPAMVDALSKEDIGKGLLDQYIELSRTIEEKIVEGVTEGSKLSLQLLKDLSDKMIEIFDPGVRVRINLDPDIDFGAISAAEETAKEEGKKAGEEIGAALGDGIKEGVKAGVEEAGPPEVPIELLTPKVPELPPIEIPPVPVGEIRLFQIDDALAELDEEMRGLKDEIIEITHKRLAEADAAFEATGTKLTPKIEVEPDINVEEVNAELQASLATVQETAAAGSADVSDAMDAIEPPDDVDAKIDVLNREMAASLEDARQSAQLGVERINAELAKIGVSAGAQGVPTSPDVSTGVAGSFQGGGTVPGAPGSSQLVVAHAGEKIVSPSASVAGAASPVIIESVVIQVQAVSDSSEVADEIKRAILELSELGTTHGSLASRFR